MPITPLHPVRRMSQGEFQELSYAVMRHVFEIHNDWGTGLSLELYESALMHFLGGEEQVVRDVNVRGDGHALGTQRMRLAADAVAFRITAFEEEEAENLFEDHARRLLRHVDLRGILWVNVAMRRVTFTSIERGGL